MRFSYSRKDNMNKFNVIAKQQSATAMSRY